MYHPFHVERHNQVSYIQGTDAAALGCTIQTTPEVPSSTLNRLRKRADSSSSRLIKLFWLYLKVQYFTVEFDSTTPLSLQATNFNR